MQTPTHSVSYSVTLITSRASCDAKKMMNSLLDKLTLILPCFCCAFYVKVDFEPFVQGWHQSHLWGLSRGWRHCNGGCQLEHGVRAAGPLSPCQQGKKWKSEFRLPEVGGNIRQNVRSLRTRRASATKRQKQIKTILEALLASAIFTTYLVPLWLIKIFCLRYRNNESCFELAWVLCGFWAQQNCIAVLHLDFISDININLLEVFSWRPFGPFDFVLRARRPLRPVGQARFRSGPPFLTIFDFFRPF